MGAEHLARRVLQMQRAVRRNALAPDFEGPSSYLLHVGEGETALPAPDLDRHVAGLIRGEALVLKLHPLAKEEQESLSKKKGGPYGGDKAAQRAPDGCRPGRPSPFFLVQFSLVVAVARWLRQRSLERRRYFHCRYPARAMGQKCTIAPLPPLNQDQFLRVLGRCSVVSLLVASSVPPFGLSSSCPPRASVGPFA